MHPGPFRQVGKSVGKGLSSPDIGNMRVAFVFGIESTAAGVVGGKVTWKGSGGAASVDSVLIFVRKRWRVSGMASRRRLGSPPLGLLV